MVTLLINILKGREGGEGEWEKKRKIDLKMFNAKYSATLYGFIIHSLYIFSPR